MTTKPEKLKKKYGRCRKCGLWRFRRNIVLGEGDMPADLLFVGEGPGKSEDLRAVPFIGPSGKLLRQAIVDAKKQAKWRGKLSYYITNTVCCRPTDKKFGSNREPSKSEVLACSPRLDLTEQLVAPKEVVLLGNIPKKYLLKKFPHAHCLWHPAYLLRQGGTGSPRYRILVRQLADVLRQLRRRKKQQGSQKGRNAFSAKKRGGV